MSIISFQKNFFHGSCSKVDMVHGKMKALEWTLNKYLAGFKNTLNNHFKTIPINIFPLKHDFSNYFDKFAPPC